MRNVEARRGHPTSSLVVAPLTQDPSSLQQQGGVEQMVVRSRPMPRVGGSPHEAEEAIIKCLIRSER